MLAWLTEGFLVASGFAGAVTCRETEDPFDGSLKCYIGRTPRFHEGVFVLLQSFAAVSRAGSV